MNKEKRIWIALFLALTLMVVLSGCSGLPKTAELNISIDPKPVTYDSQDEGWPFLITISESNGVGVTVSSIKFDSYNQEEELYDTDLFYEETIIDWFKSDYISAFSSIQSNILRKGDSKYNIMTVTGLDDNDNPVEATTRIDWLPQ